MELPKGYIIGPMTGAEVDILRSWAASEGWNPGLHDLQIAWDLAPESFVALREGDDLVGGGSILNYGGQFGFMGLFIMRADKRGKGLGTALWHWRRDQLLERLTPGASIAMDGVFDMVPFYERGGFRPAYQVLRYEGTARGTGSDHVKPLQASDIEAVLAYDLSISCINRPAFLKRWIMQPGGFAMVHWSGARITGYGVARPCDTGFKLGPVYADTPAIAQEIVASLTAQCDGQQVQVDVPEPNEAGIDLVERLGLEKVFGCTRLYHGKPLPLPLEKIFSVTSFEFG